MIEIGARIDTYEVRDVKRLLKVRPRHTTMTMNTRERESGEQSVEGVEGGRERWRGGKVGDGRAVGCEQSFRGCEGVLHGGRSGYSMVLLLLPA